jgi:hypothetical protein
VVDSTAFHCGGYRYFTHVSLPRLITPAALLKRPGSRSTVCAGLTMCCVCFCERPSSTPLQLVTRTAKTAGKGFAFLVVCAAKGHPKRSPHWTRLEGLTPYLCSSAQRLKIGFFRTSRLKPLNRLEPSQPLTTSV